MNNRRKKKEGVTDPWEDFEWVDDMPVRVGKRRKGRGVLTGNKKMIKFLSTGGQ